MADAVTDLDEFILLFEKHIDKPELPVIAHPKPDKKMSMVLKSKEQSTNELVA